MRELLPPYRSNLDKPARPRILGLLTNFRAYEDTRSRVVLLDFEEVVSLLLDFEEVVWLLLVFEYVVSLLLVFE